ncbi:MAG: P1 family peptidase [Nocardioides sp.]
MLDVAGVGVGHTTVHRDEPDPPAGRGRARTESPAYCWPRTPSTGRCPPVALLNGAGECTGFLTAAEWGMAETPIYLTSTPPARSGLRLGVPDRARADARGEGTDFIIPVVAECDDSFSTTRRMQVEHADVVAAYHAALASRGSSTPPAEGAGLRHGCPASTSRAASAPRPG